MRCPDCGTIMSNGLCSNCDEEAFIFITQYEDLPEEISEEFSNKVEEQLEKRKKRKVNLNG